MLAFEAAAKLACRLELLQRPISAADGPAVAQLLHNDGNRCPLAVTQAVPAELKRLLQAAERRRDDGLLGLWSMARDEVRTATLSESEQFWLAEVSRRVLPRDGIEALLGYERAEMLTLLGCTEVVEETTRQMKAGLSDNHLHSGAADELGSILARLVPRVADEAEPRDLASTAGWLDGAELSAGALVLALAASCSALDNEQAGDEDEILDSQAWWVEATAAVEAGAELDESQFKALREPIVRCASRSGSPPNLADLYTAFREIARGENLIPARLRAARRGLVSLALLHALIVVPARSSLGVFVPRFNLMQSVRDLLGEDYGRLTSALRSMYLDSGVTAVELRKSIVPVSGWTISVANVASKIKRAVEEHAREAAEACEVLELDQFLVRMPLTFTRLEPDPVETDSKPADFVAYQEPIGESLAVADAIVCATAAESVNRFVGAVDVVGDEKNVANWVYAIAYQRIARAEGNSLEFACHAGEYFSDQIEGLRRVAEVALFEPACVRRIGHCLSLRMDQGVEGGSRNDAEALLENAIWTRLVLEGSPELGLGHSAPGAPTELRTELKDAILKLGSPIFGVATVGIADLQRWYLDRFDLDAIAPWIPELEETQPDESNFWPQGATRSSLPKPSNLRQAMLAATIYDGSFTGKGRTTDRVRYSPGAELPASLVKHVRSLLADAEQYVSEPIRDWLKGAGIVIESCPSSNAALAGLKTGEHPVWDFHKADLRCSINTDDPALFGACLVEEYVHAGMVSRGKGGDGGTFVAELAEISRTDGMIQRPLCDGGRPVDLYDELASI